MRDFLATTAVVLTFAGYAPYIRDAVIGRTKPHVGTWLVWVLVTSVAVAIQVSSHVGPGVVINIAGLACAVVTLCIALRHGERRLTRSDKICFVFAVIAIAAWILADDPLMALIFVCAADMLGLVPTVRKSWHRPSEETLSSWVLDFIRYGLVLLALNHYTPMTLLYPLTWCAVGGVFSLFLIWRRTQVSAHTPSAA